MNKNASADKQGINKDDSVSFGRKCKRLFWHCVVRQFTLVCVLVLKFAGLIGRKKRKIQPGERFEILLTGRFDSDNWILAHLGPLSKSKECSRIWMVSTNPVPTLEKIEPIYPSKWLIKIVGATQARSLTFLYHAIRKRPHIVGGFHVMPNGIVTAITGRLIGAISMYFCVGGPAEIMGGGAFSADSYFKKIETPDLVAEKRLLKIVSAFDIVITMGTRAITFFKDNGVKSDFYVVSGGIDTNRFKPIKEKKIYDCILTGRLVEVKRIDIFLHAIKAVKKKIPDVKALIVGDGPLKSKLEQLSNDLGIKENIEFPGFYHDIENWLCKSKLFVLTSDSEGLSLSMMEATICGLPSVVSDVGDLGDLVENGVNGYLVPRRQPELFAERFIELLSDKDKLEAFSDAAIQIASSYTMQAAIERWDDILNRYSNQKTENNQMKKALSKKNLWEQKPSLVNNLLRKGFGMFPPALLLGNKFRTTCKSIEQSQWWASEKVTEYQLQKIREIVSLAYEKTGFYRQLFDEVGFRPEHLYTLNDLSKLPVIDKNIIIENIEDMCTKSINNRDVDFISTGGTSGVPLNFYMNADRSSFEYAYLTTSWKRAGYELGTPMVVLRSRIVKPDKNGLYHEYDPILRHHYYSTFHLTDENMSRYLEHIATIGSCFMHVYPSSITVMARFIQRNKIQSPKNIKGIISESEIVYPEQRKMIEEVFGCRLFSCYGQSEKVVLACGCQKSDDYHIWPTYGYFELLDKDGSSVTTPGQRGEIVGTGFINTVMPFIRYRTGDWATFVSDNCEKCGRKHMTIREIRGHRIQEILIASDGSEISWTSLNMHDDTFLHVRQFQFMQEKPGYAILRLIPAKGFSEKDISQINSRLNAKFDSRIKIKIEKVEKIALSERGKAIYVDQRIPPEMT